MCSKITVCLFHLILVIDIISFLVESINDNMCKNIVLVRYFLSIIIHNFRKTF